MSLQRLPFARAARLAVPLLALASTGACKSSNVYETDNARPNAIEFASKISNPFLQEQVRVKSAYVGNADGLIRVQLNVENTSAANALYMYKFTWFDGAGLKISGNTDFWTRRELNAGAKDEIMALAPTRNAVDWRMEIRPWDR